MSELKISKEFLEENKSNICQKLEGEDHTPNKKKNQD